MVFDGQQQSIRAMVSAEGETVQLQRPVQIVPKVEQWLSALGEEMRNTLRRMVVDCLQERTLDPARYPAQVLCLAEQIRFCSDVEKCLASVAGNPSDQLSAYRSYKADHKECFPALFKASVGLPIGAAEQRQHHR